MIVVQGIIASSLQSLVKKTFVDTVEDYSAVMFSLCSFSAPLNEISFDWFKNVQPEEFLTTSFDLCSFSTSERDLSARGWGFYFLSAQEEFATTSYSLCSFSTSEQDLSARGWGFYFLSGADFITNSFTLCSFEIPDSELLLMYPLNSTIITPYRTSIYGVSSDARTALGLSASYERFTFSYWETTTNATTYTIVPNYQNPIFPYAFLSGGATAYDASLNPLSARLTVGYQGQSYRSSLIALKPYSSILDIPNLQLWLDASDSTTLSAGTGVTKNSFIDSSSNNFTITKSGNPGQGTFTPFPTNGAVYNPVVHGGSCYFDRGGYVSTPSDAKFSFGTGDFTVEFWMYSFDTSGGTQLGMIQTSDVIGGLKQDYGSGIVITQGQSVPYQPMNGGINANVAGVGIGSTTPKISTNKWHHVALVRQSGTATLYVDGSVVGSASAPGNCTGTYAAIGGYYNGNYLFNGYLSNFRIVKGTPVYTTTFAVPTAPLASTGANTSLLLNFTNGLALDGVAKNNLVLNGDATIVNSVKKYGIGSYYFDGSGDYILAPPKEDYNFGSGDFTIECWVRFTNTTTGNEGIIDTGSTLTTANPNQWCLYKSGATLYFGRHGGTTLLTHSTSSLSPYTWYHIAVTRDNGELSMFIDGVRVASTVYSGWVIDGSNVRIGAIATPYYMNGWIDDVRLTKGIARYGPETALLLNGNRVNSNFTTTGTVTQSLSSPYTPSGNSAYFDGSSYLTSSDTNISNFGTTPFTFECWVYKQGTGFEGAIYDGRPTSGNGPYFAITTFSDNRIGIIADGSVIFTSATTFASNQWNHIAVCRTSTGTNGCTVYLNGSSIGSFTSSTNFINGFNVIGAISFMPLGNAPWRGNIADLRIVKGTALYTGSTLTVPTAPLTNVTGTSLLYNFNNGFDNNTFLDSSSNAFAITRNGSVTQGSFSPFPLNGAAYNPAVHGGSGYFDGSSYLTVPANAAFNFASGTFTVETWVMFASVAATYQILVGNYNSITTGWQIATYLNKFYVNCSGDGIDIQGTTTVVPNVWYHVAVSGSAGSYKLFVNGIQEGATYTGATSLVGGNLGIGAVGDRSGYVGSSPMNGYLSNVRIINGTALYTTNFTVPTAPLASTGSNTSLLLNFTNGGVIDSTGRNNLVTVGDAKISTAVTKYGSGSIYFDGNGDFLQRHASSDFDFGTGDFTVECWVNIPSLPGGLYGRTIVDTRPDNTNGNYWAIAIASDGKFNINLSNTGAEINILTTTTSVALNTWTHVAATRANGVVRVFIDGNLESSQTNTGIANCGQLLVGANAFRSFAPSTFFNGYIDDLRITKGVAVYTSNFTPPTSQLTITNTTSLSVAPFTPPSEHPNSSSGDPNFNNVVMLAQGNQPSDEVRWLDKSPMANVAFQTNGTLTPTLSANAIGTRSALVFNGTDHYLNLATPISPAASNVSSFFVYGRPSSGIYSSSLGNLQSSSVTIATLQWSDNQIYGFQSYSYPKNNIGSTVVGVTKNPSALYMNGLARQTCLLTLQNNTLVDNSGRGAAFTTTGTLTVSSVSISGTNTLAWYFNGSSYTTTPNTNTFNFTTYNSTSSSNVTIECWIYLMGSGNRGIAGARGNAQVNGWCVYIDGNNYLRIATAFDGEGWSDNPITGAISNNTWVHIAVVKGNNGCTGYVNGVAGTTLSKKTGFNYQSSQPVAVGALASQGESPFNGYISNFRIVRGALYNSNFTVPTPPLAALSTSYGVVDQPDYMFNWGVSNGDLNGVGVYGPTRHKGPMGEIIYANCTLPDAELELVGNNLRTKWGIT